MKVKKPLVSVIMPVYNAGEFLVEAIESILNQSYKNFEFIIVDDGSTDGTANVLRSYQERYPKVIKTYYFKKNKGESAAANFAFHKARGEFIARMDADDISRPQRLEKQIKFMFSHPRVIVLGTQAEVVNSNGEIIGKKTFPLTHKKIYENFAIFHPILHPSCMIRKSLLPNKNFLYENKFEPNDEYYTFFKLLNYGKFANLKQSLMFYRIHSDNKSLQNPKSKFVNILRIRKAAFNHLQYKPTLKALVLNLLQCIAVGLLPGKLVVPIFMVLKGMYSSSRILDKISLQFPSFRLRKNLSLLIKS